MINREKRDHVISTLEYCLKHGAMGGHDCWILRDVKGKIGNSRIRDNCPNKNCETGCVVTSIKDAIVLLKAQENSIPIDWLMQYAQLPTEIAISAWNKPMKDALKAKLRNADKPMSFDDAL